MMKKVHKQQLIDIWPIPFQNDDPNNTQIDNIGNISVTFFYVPNFISKLINSKYRAGEI